MVMKRNQLRGRKPSWGGQNDKKYAINWPSHLEFRIFLKSPVWFSFPPVGGFGTLTSPL